MTGLEMKYFVLKPKGNDVYAKASRAAMRQYAALIRQENSALHDDLMAWAETETVRAATQKVRISGPAVDALHNRKENG